MIADYRRLSEVLIRRSSDIEKAMLQAAANLKIEGLEVSARGDELIRTKLRGQMSHEEFLRLALKESKRK